jgi:hypothetical protein
MNNPLVPIVVKSLAKPNEKQSINIKPQFALKYNRILVNVVNLQTPSQKSTEEKINTIFKSIQEEVNNKENIEFDENRKLIKNNIFKKLENKLVEKNSLKEGLDLKVYMLFYENVKKEFPEYKFTNSPEKILEKQIQDTIFNDPFIEQKDTVENLISFIQKFEDIEIKKSLYKILENKLVIVQGSKKFINDLEAYKKFHELVHKETPDYNFIIAPGQL